MKSIEKSDLSIWYEKDILEKFAIDAQSDKTDGFVPQRLLLQWHITGKCNFHCTHCYDSKNQIELSTETLMKILNQYVDLLKKWNIRGHINITGGEPLLSKNLFPLIDRIFEEKETVSYAILTNGTLLNKEYLEHLRKTDCRFIQVSVEGDEEIHDSIRGKGSFKKLTDALKLVKKSGIKSMISFTLHKKNMNEFDSVVRFAEKMKADFVWSDRLIPIGTGEQMKEFMLEPKELETFLKNMYRKRKELLGHFWPKTEIKMHRALQFLPFLNNSTSNVHPYRCNAGRGLITILPDGSIVPCRRMPIIVGNILEQNLETIYCYSPLLNELRRNDRDPKACAECGQASQCKGGLRCLSFAYYGDPFRADPQCYLIQESLPDASL
jgi:radical SAM protein with 4Fe4S-binding SPASM domain